MTDANLCMQPSCLAGGGVAWCHASATMHVARRMASVLAVVWGVAGGAAWAQQAPEKETPPPSAESRDRPPREAQRDPARPREVDDARLELRRDAGPAGEGGEKGAKAGPPARLYEGAVRRQPEQPSRRGSPPGGLRENGPPRPPLPPEVPPGRGRVERRDREGPPREAAPEQEGPRPGSPPFTEGPPGGRGFRVPPGHGYEGRPGVEPPIGGFGMGGPWGDFEAEDDPQMRELNVQDWKLERQTQELAAQARRQPPQAREALRRQLAELVQQHFEVRQKRRELQLQRMTEELERLRMAIQRRNESRQAIIEQRLRDLLGESRDLDF